MKKNLLLLMTFAVMAFLGGCAKSEEQDIVVDLNVVTGDHDATVNLSLSSGKFYGAKLVEAVRLNDVDIDYTSELTLISYVRENGVDIDKFPYSHTITDLKVGDRWFTAVIVFNSEGRVATSRCMDYNIWTVVGDPIEWSGDSDAGDIGDGTSWPKNGGDLGADAGSLDGETWEDL